MKVTLGGWHVAGGGIVAGPGEVLEVGPELGALLVGGGYAEPAPGAPTRGAPTVETATAAAPERAVSRRGRRRG